MNPSSTPLYPNPQAEAAFRHWQAKYNECLMTNWTVSAPQVHFDFFCRERYTGRRDFELRENSAK